LDAVIKKWSIRFAAPRARLRVPIPRPGEVEYEIVRGRHRQGMIAQVESEIPPILLHRCELEAAGVLAGR
jgi:hypothetical protein